MSDGDPDWESNFTVLKKTVCPAILTENLFMTNKDDVRFLMSKEGFDAIVNLHLKAIKKCIEQGLI
jgi:N-acetylmuramoyl-L-alanine amidase